jgi:hypothetical protein
MSYVASHWLMLSQHDANPLMNRPRCRIRSRILWCLALAYLLTFTALLLFLQRGSPRQQTNSAIHHLRSEIHRHDNDDASPLLSTSRSYKSDSPACHPHFLSFSPTLKSFHNSTKLSRIYFYHTGQVQSTPCHVLCPFASAGSLLFLSHRHLRTNSSASGRGKISARLLRKSCEASSVGFSSCGVDRGRGSGGEGRYVLCDAS